MRIVDTPPDIIDSFESRGVSMFHAPMRPDRCRAHLAVIEAGGTLGRHPAVGWQTFTVVSGAGWVAGADLERLRIHVGQTAIWGPGEDHASGSQDGMSVLITEGPTKP